MKKLLTLTALLFSFSLAFAQYPQTQTVGSDSTIFTSKGALKGRLVLWRFADTATANQQRIKQYPGAFISVGNSLYVRDSTATHWLILDNNGVSNVTIIDSSHIQICNANGCDTITTSVTAQLVTILSDTSFRVCDTLFNCDTFYVSPTQFVQNLFDTTSIYNAIYGIYTYLGDTSFTNQFLPRGDGVVTDTIVKIDSTITRYVFTDGTYTEDTSRVYFTQDNITAITNILNYIDSVNGFDTTFINNAQRLDGEEIVTVSTDSLTRSDTLNFDYNITGKAGRVLSNDGDSSLQWVVTQDHHANGCVYGCVVTRLHDYVYNVSASGYYINDVFYESPSTDKTLSAADATDNRIDLFGVTTSNTATVIEGTAANPSLEPDYDANTTLIINSATVYAGTTEPPNSPNWIYQENVEWTTTASAGTINPNSTNNPYAGSKDVEGTNVTNATYINFVSPTAVDWSKYNYLTFQIRSKGNFSTTKKLVFRWMSSINNSVGNNVPVGSGSYGFISTQTASYQTISIPLSDFGSISLADRLRITESNTSGTQGWYLDNIQLQYIPQTTPNITVVFYGKNATRDSTVLLLSNGTRFAAFDSSGAGGGLSNITGLITEGTNVTITGTGTSGDPYVINSSGGGTTVDNAGSGYRWVTTNGSNIKTAFPGINILIDSSTNTNGLTVHADTTDGNTHLATQGDIINDRVNPIAGTNVTITGSYPNLTFNATGGTDSAAIHIGYITTDGDTSIVFSNLLGQSDTVALSLFNYWRKNGTAIYYDSAVGIGAHAPISPLEVMKNNLGANITAGITLSDTTSAQGSAPTQMNSPSLDFIGQNWNTATSSSIANKWSIYGASTSTNQSYSDLSFAFNGSRKLYISATGPVVIPSGLTATGGNVDINTVFRSTGTGYFYNTVGYSFGAFTAPIYGAYIDMNTTSKVFAPSRLTNTAITAITSGVLTGSIFAGGTGYSPNGTSVRSFTTVSGSGSGATATITISGGVVTVVTIGTTYGSGYAIGDTLSISASGTGFKYVVTSVTGTQGMQSWNTDKKSADVYNGVSWASTSLLGYTVKTANYTALLTDYTISVNNGASNVTITLPNASTNRNHVYYVKRYDNTSLGTVTIATSGGNVQSIATGSFASTTSLSVWGTYGQTLQLQSNGTDYEIIN